MILDLLYLSRQWKAIHRAAFLKPDWAEFRRLVAAYSEKGRYYHALNHLVYGLKEIDRLADPSVPNVYLAKLAYFYHDDVMIFGKKPDGFPGNEIASAQNLVAYAIRAGFHGREIKISETLVVNTANHFTCESRSPLWKIMNDADLAVFGGEESVYRKYAKNVWREYSFVGKDIYITNRVNFLNSMLDKTVFRLGPPAETARKNALAKRYIKMEIAMLTNSPEFITG